MERWRSQLGHLVPLSYRLKSLKVLPQFPYTQITDDVRNLPIKLITHLGLSKSMNEYCSHVITSCKTDVTYL